MNDVLILNANLKLLQQLINSAVDDGDISSLPTRNDMLLK